MSAHWSHAFLLKLLRINASKLTSSSARRSPALLQAQNLLISNPCFHSQKNYLQKQVKALLNQLNVILGFKQQAKKSQKQYLVWGLYGGCLCCGGIWAQIWSVWGSNVLLDRSMYVSLSKCVPETENMKRRIRIGALFWPNVKSVLGISTHLSAAEFKEDVNIVLVLKMMGKLHHMLVLKAFVKLDFINDLQQKRRIEALKRKLEMRRFACANSHSPLPFLSGVALTLCFEELLSQHTSCCWRDPSSRNIVQNHPKNKRHFILIHKKMLEFQLKVMINFRVRPVHTQWLTEKLVSCLSYKDEIFACL